VERFPVENIRQNFSPHCLLKTFENFTSPLWRKSCCGSKENGGFPHIFVLLLLLLPKISIYIFIFIIFQKEGF